MKISIGLPVYNAEKHLFKCITSVINQDYVDWELIIINDGSSDKSMDIVKSFSDRRIRLIDDGYNKGLAARINETVSLSCGVLYARMDSDDIMHQNRLSVQAGQFSRLLNLDVVGSAAYTIDDTDKITGKRLGVKHFSLEKAIQGSLFIHPTCMGKVEWFKKNRYDENRRRSEDYELWLRTVRGSEFLNIETPLLYYRENTYKYSERYISTATEIIEFLENYLLSVESRYHEAVIKKVRNMERKRRIAKFLRGVRMEELLLYKPLQTISKHEIDTATQELMTTLAHSGRAQEIK